VVQRHCLTDDQWELVADLVEAEPKPTGRPPKDRRTILNGIFWILRTGAAWRDLPERFGKWQTVYDHFNNWSKDGTFDAILRRLQGAMVDAQEIDKDLWCVDGTIVRAARCAAGAEKKGSRLRC
jgi:Transposase and inactivated derivatives